MTALRERIEARRAALLSERAIAEAAASLQADPENGWGVVGRAITPHIGVVHEAEARAHIAAQDPATTIARVDRELAGIAADLALLDSAGPYLDSWGWRDVRANLNARYPEEGAA